MATEAYTANPTITRGETIRDWSLIGLAAALVVLNNIIRAQG